MGLEMTKLRDARAEYIRLLEEEVIHIESETDCGQVIYSTRNICDGAGFNQVDQSLIATAASELAVNINRYASKGWVSISTVENLLEKTVGIEIKAEDNGPGIKDISLAVSENYSSKANSLGQGLPCVMRIMDEFYIDSDLDTGTCVIAYKWR